LYTGVFDAGTNWAILAELAGEELAEILEQDLPSVKAQIVKHSKKNIWERVVKRISGRG